MVAKYQGQRRAACRTSSRSPPTATPAPASSGRSTSRSTSATTGSLPPFARMHGASHERRTAADDLRSFVEDHFAAEPQGRNGQDAPRGVRERPPAAKCPRRLQDRRRVGQVQRPVRRQRSAATACWPGDWSRRACRSSRSATAATTRTPTTSPGTRGSCRRWSTPGRPADRPEASAACSTRRCRLDGRDRPHAADQQPRRPRPLRPLLDHGPGRLRHQGRPGLRRDRRGRRRGEGRARSPKATSSPRSTRPWGSTPRRNTTPARAPCRSRRSDRMWSRLLAGSAVPARINADQTRIGGCRSVFDP